MKQWISDRYNTPDDCKNKCNEAVRDMVRAFPELTVQVGYCNDVYHCWCKDGLGRIVDPTQKQFSAPFKYRKIADRFLKKHEIEPSTGAIFLDA